MQKSYREAIALGCVWGADFIWQDDECLNRNTISRAWFKEESAQRCATDWILCLSGKLTKYPCCRERGSGNFLEADFGGAMEEGVGVGDVLEHGES